jgi:hypothetical protein
MDKETSKSCFAGKVYLKLECTFTLRLTFMDLDEKKYELKEKGS